MLITLKKPISRSLGGTLQVFIILKYLGFKCLIAATIGFILSSAASVARSVRMFYSQTEGWVFESQKRRTKVIITRSDSSTSSRSATGVGVIVPRR